MTTAQLSRRVDALAATGITVGEAIAQAVTEQDAARQRAIAVGVPTRQRGGWQAYADRAMTGWSTH